MEFINIGQVYIRGGVGGGDKTLNKQARWPETDEHLISSYILNEFLPEN